jgi:tetratricopeptide (TPR) repeat protein
LALLNKLLEDGNTLYKRGKLPEAALRYSYAVKRLPTAASAPGGQHQKVFDQLRVHLLLNLARCKRKMKAYAEAVDLTTEVIAAHPHQFEAYHARAKAHHAAGRPEMAYADLTSAVRLAPQNRELHRILVSLKEELQTVSPLPDSGFEEEGGLGGGRRAALKGDAAAVGGAESRDSTTSSSSGVGSDTSGKEELPPPHIRHPANSRRDLTVKV